MLRSTTSNWFGVAPAWLVIGIFGLLPMFIMLAISFMVQDPYGGVEWGFSTEAYVQFLFERDLDDSLILNTIYVNIVARSIGLAALTTILCLIIGLPVAYFIARQPEDKRNLYMLLITIPFWTNLLIRTYAWILILTRTPTRRSSSDWSTATCPSWCCRSMQALRKWTSGSSRRPAIFTPASGRPHAMSSFHLPSPALSRARCWSSSRPSVPSSPPSFWAVASA
jgi:hypothetical protein